ncbi:ras protein let-60-like [Antechinus flavipes]|uniref:ras protein let-60-like n=1 Tax=Antechinus flavipes TaxID=38775 RepID=UPI002235B917|nr:ras protein let-60-like [Antechinus flavipes]
MASCVHTSIGDPDEHRSVMYKMVVMGTCYVGKSALTIQFTKNNFITQYDPTVQDFYSKDTVVDEEPCQLDIVDSTGTEIFFSLRDQNVRWGEGFLVVYGVSDLYSFENVNVLWDHVRSLKHTDRVPMVLVANKVDVTDRLVDPRQGQEAARRFGVPYVETSAKTGEGVEQAFHELVGEIRKIRAEEEHKRLTKAKWGKTCGRKCCTIQ